MMGFLKRYLIAGILVWLPLGVTILVINFLVGMFDRTILLIPTEYRPEALLGFEIPGLGLLMSLLIVFITGMLVANFLGGKLVKLWEGLLSRIPIVSSIYSAIKQISEAVFGNGGQTFQKVYLIQYPRNGLWTLAFQTSLVQGEAQEKTGLLEVVNMFVPTTPNPTSGFFIMAARHEIVELDISVDDALKMVISGGVVVPPWQAEEMNKKNDGEETAAIQLNNE